MANLLQAVMQVQIPVEEVEEELTIIPIIKEEMVVLES